MKATIITSKHYKSIFSSRVSSQSWPFWRFPLQLGLLLCPLLLGAPQGWAQPGAIASSIWSSTNVPVTITVPDSGAVELGLRFRSAVDGNITGIRFYKSSSNAGLHVGNLWTSNGTPLGSVPDGLPPTVTTGGM